MIHQTAGSASTPLPSAPRLEPRPGSEARAVPRPEAVQADTSLLGPGSLEGLSDEAFDLEGLSVPEPQEHAGGYGTAATGSFRRTRSSPTSTRG
ncbi:MAG: hypothetical protein VKQ33_00110 [Candidatus Sericytochromatia bacterium]|nr:hypothetical protein [Candidatus Sericytochromatia bacterium]